MISSNDILSTVRMIDQQHLDVRTITMGVSLLDCCDPDPTRACRKIYDKITASAEHLVQVGEEIETEFGIPIVNKRISVTPIALVAGASDTEDYVPFARAMDEAAKAVGISTRSIIVSQILPNALSTILVQATMMVSANILSGTMLSFLGLGVPVPRPEWGAIMSDGLDYIRYASHLVIFPTIFIAITALSINILGDGLRDAFDPRLKGKA